MGVNLKLYEITNRIRDLLEATSADGELGEFALASLDRLNLAMSEKIDAICGLIREWEAFVSVREAERMRLLEGIGTYKRNIVGLKEYLRRTLLELGTHRYDTPLFKMWRQASPPAAKCQVDPATLPDGLRRVTVEPDVRAALEQWKATGEAPTGFTIEQGEHLRIK